MTEEGLEEELKKLDIPSELMNKFINKKMNNKKNK